MRTVDGTYLLRGPRDYRRKTSGVESWEVLPSSWDSRHLLSRPAYWGLGVVCVSDQVGSTLGLSSGPYRSTHLLYVCRSLFVKESIPPGRGLWTLRRVPRLPRVGPLIQGPKAGTTESTGRRVGSLPVDCRCRTETREHFVFGVTAVVSKRRSRCFVSHCGTSECRGELSFSTCGGFTGFTFLPSPLTRYTYVAV